MMVSTKVRWYGGEAYVPLRTEVMHEHQALVTKIEFTDTEGYLIHLDARRAKWGKILKLPPQTKIHFADVRTTDINDLSSLRNRLTYRLTHGDGWYLKEDGERQYFPLQPHLSGIDIERGCTTTALRAAVLLAVFSGVGVRTTCWLMSLLFLFPVTKSSLQRWIKDCASRLPDLEWMVKKLNSLKKITDISIDEIFPKGMKPKQCVLVLRDQLGRILFLTELEERTEAAVVKILEKLKEWGISPDAFYMDGCVAYRNAVASVFPKAKIQYDYFHVIQCLFKKLWKSVVERRKNIKARSKLVKTEQYASKLASLAARIWDNRWVFFKRDKNITETERADMVRIIAEDRHIWHVRVFVKAVWSIFEDNTTEKSALDALAKLKKRSEFKSHSCFDNCISFLESRFSDMTAFIRYPEMRRNSLSETGMRFLRRLEQGHDGFRSTLSMEQHLKIYQAVKYLGWSVYGYQSGLNLRT
jgi:hypothetical protein